ncbi:MAG: hypothetical protein FIA96_06025 [Betaproteobacteria bacterium]|nr:hypothetical protein [Betaproteobacteria bacterium]
MKNTLLSLSLTALLAMAMAMEASAAPPSRGGGGAYRGHSSSGGYHGHPAWRSGRHGGHWGPSVGIYYGAGFGYWGPWNYGWGLGYAVPYPYPYAYPYSTAYPLAYAPVVINSTPIEQTYIQRDPVPEAAVQAAPTVNYWYYCTQPAGYFPYVQNCNQAWIKVVPPNSVNQQ